MSSSHNDSNNFPSNLELYEGDQSTLYSGTLAHHGTLDSPESKKKVRKIWMITLWLTIITIAEVAVGLLAHKAGMHNTFLTVYFLLLTLVKAILIIKVFMHLGDERKDFIYLLLSPLVMFFWLVIAFLADGDFWLRMNMTIADTIKDLIK